MEHLDVRMARIEELCKHISDDVREIRELVDRVHDHDLEIALLKRDHKWERRIQHSISGFVGAAIMGAIEWFRK